MDRIELQKLRDLPIEGVAERLGLRVVRHKCLCPFHDDHHASLSFSVRRNTFRCFACDAHGGTIDLAMRLLPSRGGREGSFLDACRWLGGSPTPTNRVTSKASPAGGGLEGAPSPAGGGLEGAPSPAGGGLEGAFDPARYERFFLRPWLSPEARRFLFDERQLDERVVRWCRLTSWRDREGVNWLQIPYFDREGKLIGVQNRNLGKSPSASNLNKSPSGDLGGLPRFRFPYGSRCSIYNLPVLNLLRPGEELWITEGCSDCWAMLSAGHKAIAIPSATLLKPSDVEILSTLNSKLSTPLHMYPDRDEPGERLFLQLQQLLPNLEHHQLPPDCKDFSEFYLATRRRRAP